MFKVMFQSAILDRKPIESSRQNSPQQTTKLGSCVHIWCFLETKFQTRAYGSRLQLTLLFLSPLSETFRPRRDRSYNISQPCAATFPGRHTYVRHL